MSDPFALRSGGRMGLHSTASSSEMQPEENIASKSSDELQSTKGSLYLLKYVLETYFAVVLFAVSLGQLVFSGW